MSATGLGTATATNGKGSDMAEKQAAPKCEPRGPGILMIFGLFLLGIAGWCARDFLGLSDQSRQAWEHRDWFYLLFNGTGFVGGIGFAIYTFVLAAIRSKRGIGTPPAEPPAGPDRPQDT